MAASGSGGTGGGAAFPLRGGTGGGGAPLFDEGGTKRLLMQGRRHTPVSPCCSGRDNPLAAAEAATGYSSLGQSSQKTLTF